MRMPTTPRRHEDGAAAVEFALIFVGVVAPLFLGILQYGWYFYTYQATGAAVRDTARRLSVGDCWGSGEAQTYARKHANLTNLSLSATPAAPDVGNTLTVIGTLPASAQPLTFFPFPNGGVVEKAVQIRVEDMTSSGTC